MSTPRPESQSVPAGNFRIPDDRLGEGGPKAKYAANIAAIRVLKQLESEGRSATLEEQETLSRYVGWGGIPDAFDVSKSGWAEEYQQLKALLTEDEYASARASTLNTHFTAPVVIRAIYEALDNMGFKTGNILEPSCGVGNFFGCLPEGMSASRLYGVELDSISGRIARLLYPKASITVAGFETTDRRDFFDLAVGNVPFGDYKINDPAYDKHGFNVHNYFLCKTLDQLRPGGVMAFVTSRYTMDSKDGTARKYLAERADLLGAIRLPNTAFKANAGTDVVSDILFFQKLDMPNPALPDWVSTMENQDGYPVNSYFLDYPEMVLGRPGVESTRYGHDYTVYPSPGADLAQQLHEAMARIHGKYRPAEVTEPETEETAGETIVHLGDSFFAIHCVCPGIGKVALMDELAAFSNQTARFQNVNRGILFAGSSYREVLSELEQPSDRDDAKLLSYGGAYHCLQLPVHLLSCDSTGAVQLQIMAVPDYRRRLTKAALKGQYRPPPPDAFEWDAIFQGSPFVLAADMDLRRMDTTIRTAKAEGYGQIAMAALEGQAQQVLFPRYRDTGLARVFVLTAEAIAEATGRKPVPYAPPRTQFLTSKGDVADAPLIPAHRKT